MSVAERFRAVRAELPDHVAIVGVVKKQPPERVREAIDAGLRILADNYVQEGRRVREQLGPADVAWHFIGHIQSRKAKDLVPYACVQSLDRLSVAEELDRRARAAGRTIDCLVEVNIGAEDQKSGIAPGEVGHFFEGLSRLGGLRLRGIMGMPPPLLPVESRRPHFRELKRLFETHRARYSLDVLSMGTSADYLVAVQEGATMVRLGTTLFGIRS